MIYKDFDLLLERAPKGFRAQVLSSTAGQATVDFQLPFSDVELENCLLKLGRTTRLVRRIESSEMTTAKTFGAALFNAVFAGDVRACLRSAADEAKRENTGVRLRIRLADPALADLPWEFLYNPAVNRFLALSIQSPLVRYMELPEVIQPIAVTPPIRVLVMISSPTDYPTLDVEAEWKRLNESLADLIAAGTIAVDRLDGATLGGLQRKLRRCAVPHLPLHRPRRVRSDAPGRRVAAGAREQARASGGQPVSRDAAARPRVAAGGDSERLRGGAQLAAGSVRGIGAEPGPTRDSRGHRDAVRDRRRRRQHVRARVLRRARGSISDRCRRHRGAEGDFRQRPGNRMGDAGAVPPCAGRPDFRRGARGQDRRAEPAAGAARRARRHGRGTAHGGPRAAAGARGLAAASRRQTARTGQVRRSTRASR